MGGTFIFAEGYRLLQESKLRALPVVQAGKLTIEDVGHAGLLRQPDLLSQKGR